MAALFGWSGEGLADTSYTYTGNNFSGIIGPTYDASMSVSGSFSLSAPLPRNLHLTDIRGQLLSFSFSDAVQTRTHTNSYIALFAVATDAEGQISEWRISIVALPEATNPGEIRGVIDSFNRGGSAQDAGGQASCAGLLDGLCVSFGFDDYGYVSSAPGSWVRAGETPPVSFSYGYTGNAFDIFEGASYSTDNSVSGEFLLATPLPPNLPLTDVSDAVLSFSFTDGVQVRTRADSYVIDFRVGTNGLGAIDQWEIYLVEGPPATTPGEVRSLIETEASGVFVGDLAGTGTCINLTNGLCTGFAVPDSGSVTNDPGAWVAPGPLTPDPTEYGYAGNTFNFIQGPSYDMSMFISGRFTTRLPLPPNMAMTNINHALTGFSFFDGVVTRTMPDSWGWEFKVETDATGNIVRWKIFLQEDPEAMAAGEVRHLLDTINILANGLPFSLDSAGSGTCQELTNGTCTLFILFDYGEVSSSAGGWEKRDAVMTVTSPVPALGGIWPLVLALLVMTLGGLRLRL